MKKIRINELARELEVKPGVILDLLPELGVREKKTHSSSIDEDVAIQLRERLHGAGEESRSSEARNGESAVAVTEHATGAPSGQEPIEEQRPPETAKETVATEKPAQPERAEPKPVKPLAAPIRPPTPGAPAADASTPSEELNKAAESDKPAKPFQPLRPPLGGGTALHPPLASPSSPPSQGLVNRSLSVPARPAPPPLKPGQAATGPRQPLPADLPKPSTPVPPPRTVPKPPVQPGAQLTAGAPIAAKPGAPAPRPPAPRPPASQIAPGLTPGVPIVPRTPPSERPTLAGQPAARPIVPPRPDLVARLQQTRTTPPVPGAPRPGAPARPSSPTPGQPIYRGPIRPGQPLMRGPGGPGGPQQFRRPGQRPMHPTSPLRAEPAAPPPTEQQRRHQAKPGGRNVGRRRDEREGNLREPMRRQTVVELPPIDREITIAEGITVKELSEKLGVKANLVVKKLVEKKIFATINQTMDVKLAEELARDFGASTNKVSYEEETTQDFELAEDPKDLVKRAPVVTIMGHVDHGKTSLLDAIRFTNVADREAGGITQHIGAYHVEKNGQKIVFIDTPGHEAFTRMRARGAKVTDIVVLVVSADDGVMPQTIEAIDHAKVAKVPIIVAINKMDKPEAQPERVKQQLADRGLLAEDWGGDVVMVPVSAKAKTNLDLLLEMILLVADMQNLKANPNRPALGTVLEAKLDRGRGPVATMLVGNGTLKSGDYFICGSIFSKVRAMFDDRGNPVKEAEPSMPVEVIGLEDLPEVGDSFQVVSDTSKAKQIVIYREAKAREAAMAKGARVATLDSLHQQMKEGDLKDLNLIIKADVGGTAEVLSDTLQKLSTDKIRVRVLRTGVGAITESDVLLASTAETNAIIIGFNVRPDRNASATAEQQKVEIRLYSVIYQLIDEVKQAMTGMLEPVFKEIVQGHAEVKETFRITKVGTVAGCFVTDGFIKNDSQIRVLRENVVVYTGKISALKRFKNDASEVKNGVECGISITNYNDVRVGDVLEAFMMERLAPQLTA